MGSGGLYTTVEDLFLWDQNFYHYQVGGKGVIDTVLTRGKLNSNEEITYAFGLWHGEYKGLKTVGHSGALGGYRGILLRFPAQKFSLICLSNFAAFDPAGTCYQVADIYLKDQFKPLPEKTETKEVRADEPITLVSPSPEDLQEYVGEFFSEELNVTYKFIIQEGKLYVKFRNAPDSPLKPTIKDEFELNRIWCQFSRDNEGKIKGFTLVVGDIMRIPFEKLN